MWDKPLLQHVTNENSNICFQYLGKKPWSHDEKISEEISLMFSVGQTREEKDKTY